ncbi:MAG: hypothetical protein H0X29_09180 [Parachlamydiaceae bacterium]|nr:hypothetical protein [Parachlamydiaceae bacterium]
MAILGTCFGSAMAYFLAEAGNDPANPGRYLYPVLIVGIPVEIISVGMIGRGVKTIYDTYQQSKTLKQSSHLKQYNSLAIVTS